ncbi:MAG: hypothetical protein K2N72_12250 [Oscillospiraceae bacterium]|nr:hypothetical protein [Oscillospiraceae bacterium]
MSNNKKKIANIIEGVVIAILIALIGSMLFLYFSFGEKGAAPKVFGYTIYHTHATNMEPKIPAGTVIFAKESEIDNIKAGSVVLCNIDDRTVLTRVVQLVNENGVMSYVVRFDTASEDITYKIPRESVIARAVRQDEHMGALLDFATSTKGIMIVIIIPSFIIIVFQIIRIVNAKRVEEDAYSLDDLDEIMLDHDDDTADSFFSEPEVKQPAAAPPKPEPEAVIRIVRDDSAEPEVKFAGDAPRQVLSVDKNGKAELKFTEVDKSQLFTYDNLEITGGKREEPANAESARIDLQKESRPKESVPNFMSNVLPEKIAVAAGNVGQSVNETPAPKAVKRPVRKAAVSGDNGEKMAFTSNSFASNTSAANTAVENAAANAAAASASAPAGNNADRAASPAPAVVRTREERAAASAAQAIPAKAVVPKEKLAPPPKKSNGKTISELMSIIDAEESKLK